MSNIQVTLHAGASVVDDFYNNWWIKITSGLNEDQVRHIIDYDGTTQVATLESEWTDQNPSSNDTFNLYNKPFVGIFYDESDDKFVFGATTSDPGNSPIILQDYMNLNTKSLNTNIINELTNDTGVYIDDVLIKDGGLIMKDSTTFFQDNTTTKQFQFDLTGITPGETRILNIPDENGTITLNDAIQTLTNKTITMGGVLDINSNNIINTNDISIDGNYKIGEDIIIDSSRIAKNIVRYDMSNLETDQLIFRKTHRSSFGDKIEKNIKLESRFPSTVLAGFGGQLDFSISSSNLGDIDLGFLRWNLATTASGGRGDISIFSRPNSTDPYNEFRFRGDGIMLLKTIGGINDTLNIMDNLNFENNEGIRWGSASCQIIGNASTNNINITSNNLNVSNTLITTTQTRIISIEASPLFVQRNTPNTSNVSWNVMELCSNKPSSIIDNGMGIAMLFSNDENSTNKITHGRITTRTTDSEKNTCEILISPYNAGSARDFIFSGKTGDLTIAGQYLQSSSLKYKEEIVELPEEIMNDFNKLKPKKYKAKNTNIINYGLIAEEVYEINDSYKNLVHKRNDEIDALNYMGFIPILVKKIQEQQEKIDSLTNIINDLLVRISNLENN
jgi:hypothetical protein